MNIVEAWTSHQLERGINPAKIVNELQNAVCSLNTETQKDMVVWIDRVMTAYPEVGQDFNEDQAILRERGK